MRSYFVQPASPRAATIKEHRWVRHGHFHKARISGTSCAMTARMAFRR